MILLRDPDCPHKLCSTSSWYRDHSGVSVLSHGHCGKRWLPVGVSCDGGAILRLGAHEEDVVRHERIMPDGRKRNLIRFSIIDDEWPAVKAALQIRMHQIRTNQNGMC